MSETLPMAKNRIKSWGDKYGLEMDMGEAEEMAAEMVMTAYEEMISPVEEYKRQWTTEFENAFFKECYEEVTSDSEYAPENERRVAVTNSPEMDAYQFAIAQKIRRNWSVPASAGPDTVCVARVRQIPGGEIDSVNILSCNGDEAVKRSVEAAIYRSSPLPEPLNPDLFRADLELSLRPE